MRILIGAMALAVLAGCSTSPMPSEKAKPAPIERVTGFQSPSENAATIVVTRDTGYAGGGCFAAVYLNGNRVAKLNPGEKATFFVPAGEWIIGAGLEGAALCGANPARLEVTTNVGPGQLKKFRVYNPGDSAFHIAPTTF